MPFKWVNCFVYHFCSLFPPSLLSAVSPLPFLPFSLSFYLNYFILFCLVPQLSASPFIASDKLGYHIQKLMPPEQASLCCNPALPSAWLEVNTAHYPLLIGETGCWTDACDCCMKWCHRQLKNISPWHRGYKQAVGKTHSFPELTNHVQNQDWQFWGH